MALPQQAEEDSELRYAYNAEWDDPVSGNKMAFTLLHWPQSSEAELVDAKKRKTFLKRTQCEGLGGSGPLRPGSFVTVMARRLQILSPADAVTRDRLSETTATRTFAMVKPDATQHLGAILSAIYGAGLTVVHLRMAWLAPGEAAVFYAVHQDRPFFAKLQEFMTSGPIVAMQLEGADAVPAWRTLLGPTNSATAREQAPSSLRARYGTDNTKNACHGSDAAETAAQEAAFFFGASSAAGLLPLPGDSDDLTVAIIKPHAVAAGVAGGIVEQLQAHFDIVAAEAVNLSPSRAEQFHAVYKGVVTPALFAAMVQELASGTAIVLALTWRRDADHDPSASLVDALRELAGPGDPELARAAAPGSLRARFGDTEARNAVHVTDLAQDGRREAEFLFGSSHVEPATEAEAEMPLHS